MTVKAQGEITFTNIADGADGTNGQMLYGACNTASATVAKVPASTIAGFSLAVGASVAIKFTYANSADAPTLNINSTGAKFIRLNGANSVYWAAGATVQMVYDGTYWQVCNTPLYGSTATIGNPAGGNVYTDSDSVDIRNGTNVLGTFVSTATYTAIQSSATQMLFMVPTGKTIAMTTYDSLGQPSDNGVGMIGNDAVIRSTNVQTISKTIPGTRFETAIQPEVLYNGGAALAYETSPGAPALNSGIVLSESAANFHTLILYYKTDDGHVGGPAIVIFPDTKIVDLTCNVFANGTMYIKAKAVLISGTSINTALINDNYWTGIYSSAGMVQMGDQIGIYRVEGIR